MPSKTRAALIIVVLLLLPALWVLKVEITYERNVRHIPAAFRPQHHSLTRLWKA